MKTTQVLYLMLIVLTLTAQTIKVDGKKIWTDTGIDVAKGQKVSVTATGKVFANATVSGGPEGISGRPDWDQYCVVKGKLPECLIVKIGEGEAFYAGKSITFTATESGRIFLGVNDTDVGNNKGEFIAQVTIAKPVPESSGGIKVPGNKAWTGTGVIFGKGRKLKIAASGEVLPNGVVKSGPEGVTDRPDWDVYCVVKSKGHAGLIARIGNGLPFYVGNSFEYVTDEPGELFLGVNDTDIGNNKGEFSVILYIE